ncbi:MAG: thiamine pyrophosphate-binding protein [Pseudomonadales bacterium]|nr:thiamine pyrophosphate-binding protein [Pseudomonadales bacterium]
MRGRQVLMESLRLHGVDCIFGNPGTTENPLLDSLIDYPDIKYYVALHEGVAVGAAGFYAQATGKTGITNLHVAPGLGNAIGMIYGALKANSPMIVTAGQQDTRLRLRNPLLGHDLVAMATAVTKWSVQPESADEIGPLMQRAFKVAHDAPAGPVFVALPVNVMEQETSVPATTAGNLYTGTPADPAAIADVCARLLGSNSPAIVAGDDVATSGAAEALVKLAEKTGAAVFNEGLRAQLSFPNRHPNFRGRIPFEAANIRRMLGNFDLVLLIGGQFFEEVWFDEGNPVPESVSVIQIESSRERLAFNFSLQAGVIGHIPTVLNELNEALDKSSDDDFAQSSKERNEKLAQQRSDFTENANSRLEALWDRSPMYPVRAIHEIRAALPDNAIIVDESITASLEVAGGFDYREPGDYYAARGGGIGQGIAGAIGTQVAHPDRPVIALSGDGSAMYSIQAFWTAAHHRLPIVFIILSNREYRVLKHNMDTYRQRFDAESNRPYPHMNLTEPTLDFASMARGMGVDGTLVEDPAQLQSVVKEAIAARRPHVIEVVIAGKE